MLFILSDKAQNWYRGKYSVPVTKFRLKMRLNKILILKRTHLCYFHAFFGGATLNKKVTMETTKGLFMICKSENLAYTYLQKVTKCKANGFCRLGVLTH